MLSGALALAKKRVDDDATTTWLLVAFTAFAGFTFSVSFLFILVQDSLGSMSNPGNLTGAWAGLFGISIVAGIFLAFGIALVIPVLVVVGALRAYNRQYAQVSADLRDGGLALMLVDESYGRMIQEWREQRYRPVLGEVHLGQSFAARLIHFAAYYPQYRRLAHGEREFAVRPATPLNCWMDGLLVYCLGCQTGCYWFIVPLPLRVVYTYPKSLAVRRAAVDFFLGKWEEPQPAPPPAPLQSS